MSERSSPRAHLDPAAFAEAVRYTAARTGFDPRLVEKDYFCTLVLEQLVGIESLVFKGGTCLAKVHAGFYRLSEDLDFAIATTPGTTRGTRRGRIEQVKAVLGRLEDRQPALRLATRLTGANVSTQYVAAVAYMSLLTRAEETIKLEVALREPLLVQPIVAAAATLLLDPISDAPLVEGVPVTCLAPLEAFAEKLRAALTRREPAIRDFFDIDWTARRGLLVPDDPALVSLLTAKLQVAGNAGVDVTTARLAALRRQLDLGLRPVLRPADFEAFDLERAFTIVSEMAAKMSSPK